jgi:hypothetical protein
MGISRGSFNKEAFIKLIGKPKVLEQLQALYSAQKLQSWLLWIVILKVILKIVARTSFFTVV